MPRKGKRRKIATGVYEDASGRSAVVTVGRERREKRFPLDHPLRLIEAWRVSTKDDLLHEQIEAGRIDGPAPERGTFNGDLPRRLKQIEGRPSFKADRSHLRAWKPYIGPMPRSVIRPSHVSKAVAAWQAAGKSARTLRHRLRVLRELYHGLDGAHARPPIKGVKLPRPAAPTPTAVAPATIKAVAKSLKAGKRHEKGFGSDSDKAYARFLVRATTGQRPIQIGRAKPEDVDLERRIWFVRPAKGGLAIPLPLSDDMVEALRTFIKADAWGTFDARSFAHTLHRHGWPKGIRPYNLRHTFAIDHLLAGTSLSDLQGLLGHAQIETTRRHYAPVMLALLRKTVGRRKLKLT